MDYLVKLVENLEKEVFGLRHRLDRLEEQVRNMSQVEIRTVASKEEIGEKKKGRM